MGTVTMRNDAHDDSDGLAKLNTERIEPKLSTTDADELPFLDSPLTAPAQPTAASSNKAVGALSALTLAILCSTAAFGWWSMQRIELLEQQLIATQDSFSKISEDAAGRISAITGQFTATESSVLGDLQALTQRLTTLESNAIEAHKQQQISLTAQAADLSTLNTELLGIDERTQRLNTRINQHDKMLTQHSNRLTEQSSVLHKTLTEQQERLSQFEHTVDNNQQLLSQLQHELDNHQQQLVQLDSFNTQLQSLTTQLTQLKNNSNNNDAIQRLQQDLLIVRSELEQRPAPVANSQKGPSLADFDAYRAQTNRTISTLQEQVRNLQKNTP